MSTQVALLTVTRVDPKKTLQGLYDFNKVKNFTVIFDFSRIVILKLAQTTTLLLHCVALNNAS